MAGLLAFVPACTSSPSGGHATAKRTQGNKPITAEVRAEKVPTDVAAEVGDLEDFTSSSCGVERWTIKTGTDKGAKSINITSSTATTLAKLIALKPPATIPSNSRVKGAETTNWHISVTLVEYKIESDSDYHLVLKVGRSTMIAEIPSPSCVGSTSPFKVDIKAARAAFDKKFPNVSSSWHTANIPVVITGVGFFDYKHGQTGVAPNAIEIHPVLKITFGAAPKKNFAMTVTPPEVSIAQGTHGSVTLGTSVSGASGAPNGLRVIGLPPGVTAVIDSASWVSDWPASLAALPGRVYPYKVSFSVGANVPPADYTVRLSGSAAGSRLWTQIVLTVVSGASRDFYLEALPGTITVARGHTGTLRIRVLPLNGYRGPTYPAINGLPLGVTATFSPAVIDGGGTYLLHVSVSQSAQVGTHAVTLGAAGGSRAHVVLVALHVRT